MEVVKENIKKIYGLLIDGIWLEKKQTIDVINPSTLELAGQVAESNEQDVENAVDAAERAFCLWSKVSPEKRAELLYKAAALVKERADIIACLMTMEEGKPFSESRGEVMKGAEILRFYGEEAKRIHGETIPGFDTATSSSTVFEPIGVAAAISPWNYPVELIAWKIGAALGSGCTIVVKPPSETPLSPAAFIECIVDAGAPAGIINIVFGKGRIIGPLLIMNKKIKKVAFTGSTRAGREVASLCGNAMKKVSLELGGQCPMIVTKNANISEAARAAARRSFRNNGQICIAINRIYVERDISNDFLEKFIDITSKLKISDGIKNPDADMGPMATKAGFEKTVEHVADAVEKGARIVWGGKKPAGKEYEKGYFFMPTIISDTNHKMKIMQEETFGPVVGVMPFDTIDEAIFLANDTSYGLAAYVYTDNLHEADRFARELEMGNVAVNNPDAGVINAPYGGFKDSGTGYEHGKAGMMEYLRTKHIRIKYFMRTGK